MQKHTVLVTGGAGYIGSHTCLELIDAGYAVVVLDDLSNSSPESLLRVAELTGCDPIPLYEGDVRDTHLLERVFSSHQIGSVIHFAGLKAVGESVEQPLRYYDTNVGGTIKLLQVMQQYEVKCVVFSSTATVYGDPASSPITEDFPRFAMSPYAASKLMVEDVMMDLHRSDNSWQVGLLRYFNPVGAHESGRIGEDPQGKPNNLMPYIAKVAIGEYPTLSVFGDDYETPDGTGVRDYIHVVDLAKGHVKALQAFHQDKVDNLLVANLGAGQGYSVLEMVAAFADASGCEIPYEVVARRDGDVASYFANSDYAAQALGWKAEKSLAEMCADTWRWQSQNPKGYA